MLSAGSLDRRITLMRHGAEIDDGFTTRPGPLMEMGTRWASWRPTNGRRVFENLGRETLAAGSFWLRSDAVTRQLVEVDKIGFADRVWDIVSITELGRRDGLEIMVTASDDYGAIDLSQLQPIETAVADGYTGWAAYVHTGADQVAVVGTETALLNDAGFAITSQLPTDVSALYDGTRVTGREGDSVIVAAELTFTPDDGQASNINVSIDVGGAIGKLYPQDFPITKGALEEHKISYVAPAYTLDTWEANGGVLTYQVDGPGTFSAVRYVIHRLHKAR
ncbi:MAG: head-tail adaptor protein [Pseudomonadota bacterium]